MREKNKVLPGLICGDELCHIREAVCVTAEKVYDACKEKDCVEDARVFFKNPEKADRLLRKAINVKVRKAEIIDVFADVEEVPFKRGFYTVDIKFFIAVTLDFFVPTPGVGIKIVTVPGLVTFDKKVILFGSEGNVKIFKSHYAQNAIDNPLRTQVAQDNLPVSLVEVAEPIALNAKIADLCECDCCCDCCCDCGFSQIPDCVLANFENSCSCCEFGLDEIDLGCIKSGADADRVCLVSLGIFSIVKLIRNVQLLIPAFDFCVPNKDCVAATEDNPCELFDSIEFPEDEFFPPQKFDFVT